MCLKTFNSNNLKLEILQKLILAIMILLQIKELIISREKKKIHLSLILEIVISIKLNKIRIKDNNKVDLNNLQKLIIIHFTCIFSIQVSEVVFAGLFESLKRIIPLVSLLCQNKLNYAF